MTFGGHSRKNFHRCIDRSKMGHRLGEFSFRTRSSRVMVRENAERNPRDGLGQAEGMLEHLQVRFILAEEEAIETYRT